MNLEAVTLVIAGVVICSVVLPTLKHGSPPWPTSPTVRAAMLEVLPRKLPGGPGGRIYELGSAWGGNAFALARRYPDRVVTGVEISPFPYLMSRLRCLLFPRDNLSFVRGNFLDLPVRDASLVVCYLMPATMERLSGYLRGELPDGALVLSNTFALPGWRPVTRASARDFHSSPLYLYEKSHAAFPDDI